jgi:tRNA pseudouridine32 synthase/23S rRNA pseudouridine746 synthase
MIKPDPFIAPVCHESINIVFQDEHLLIINKPSGLLSLSGKNPLNKDSVHYRLVQQYPTATMAHRIDFGTSGVMVLALNKTVNGHLTRQFQDRTVGKTYTAILRGHIANDTGSIDIPIIKDADNFPYQKVCYTTGKNALSHYQVIERLDDPCSTRVLFSPHTGRTHQLRIHSQAIGHPILGCDLYGDHYSETTDSDDGRDDYSHDNEGDSVTLAKRLLLHATTLAFEHPMSGERLTFEVACPF